MPSTPLRQGLFSHSCVTLARRHGRIPARNPTGPATSGADSIPSVPIGRRQRSGNMTFRTISLVVVAALGLSVIPLHARAATPPADSAAATPRTLPPERVKDALSAYQQWLDRLDQRNEVAGLATAVVVDDKV